MTRTRYAQVGLGIRSWAFSASLLSDHCERAELVGLCDSNPGRLGQRLLWAQGAGASPAAYDAEHFDRMLQELRPDCVIVTPPDRDHAHYICRAMELGCDVISEKPLTIDADTLQRILDTQRATGRRITVTFNYRYAGSMASSSHRESLARVLSTQAWEPSFHLGLGRPSPRSVLRRGIGSMDNLIVHSSISTVEEPLASIR